MRGRIKTLNNEREFGFIVGEDGNDYFFHFSNVTSVDFPTKNSIVEFEAIETEKGYSAKNVSVKEIAVKRPEIVKFGSISIRIKNIKMYAIYSGYTETQKWIPEYAAWIDANYIVEREHLCVQTFQGEKYRFFADETNFDIYEKKAELDRLLTM